MEKKLCLCLFVNCSVHAFHVGIESGDDGKHGLFDLLDEDDNFRIVNHFGLGHNLHLIFFFDLIFLVNVIINKGTQDDGNQLSSFWGARELLKKILEEFGLLLKNFMLEGDDVLKIINTQVLSVFNLFLNLLTNSSLKHVDFLVVTLFHKDYNRFFKVIV